MKNFEKIEHKNKQKNIIFKYEDLRGKDLSKENLSNIPLNILKTITFDTETLWPAKENLPEEFDPEKILEEGKNPGLGIRELHKQGITGQGVMVAIIDQKLDVNHPEYKNSIFDYSEYGKIEKETISMHGPAVASLLVGKNCGVAPGAKLIYKAIPAGRNFLFAAKALNEIIEKNKIVQQEEKIRVVSCSIGYILEKKESGLNEWIHALKKAKEAGIFVVDASGNQIGVKFIGGGSPTNKEDPETYIPWLYYEEKELNKPPFGGNIDEELKKLREAKIVVPSDYRTMASSWRKEGQYMYNGRGGISWSVPYLAGIIALALQIKPDIKQKEIAEIINKTAIVNTKSLRIINPKGIIESIKAEAL